MANKFYAFVMLILCGIYLSPTQVTGQNKYTVKIVQPDPVQAPVITSVTVSTENKNQLAWEQTENENISYFKIYRDAAETEGAWIHVGNISYPGSYTFTDPSSYPNVRSYKYRISTIDKCGNEIYNILNHKTIKLTVDQTSDASNLLMWNPYEGFEVGGYKIYKGVDAANLLPVDTTSALKTNYTDLDNTTNNIFYQVEAIGKEEYQSLKKQHLYNSKTRSNVASNRSFITTSDTAGASKIHVYPNPLVINAVVVFPYEADQKFQLSILDLTGKLVYTKPVFSGEIEIERKNLKEGLYILQVAGKKIYRKKLIVGSFKA
jgi:trimeric autotransporter adhesin